MFYSHDRKSLPFLVVSGYMVEGKRKPDLVSVENNLNRVLFFFKFFLRSPGQLSHLQVCRDTPTQDKCIGIKQVEREEQEIHWKVLRRRGWLCIEKSKVDGTLTPSTCEPHTECIRLYALAGASFPPVIAEVTGTSCSPIQNTLQNNPPAHAFNQHLHPWSHQTPQSMK